MNQQNQKPYSDHDQIWQLLPWYVNSSLENSERERVHNHLRVCLLCRREVAAQAMLAKRLQHEPRLEISAKPSFDRLMARIQNADNQIEEPAPSNPRKAAAPAKTSWLAGWVNELLADLTPPRLVAACASLLLALALPFLAQTPTPAPVAFHTVADNGSLDRYSPNDLRIIFAEQLTALEKEKLIGAIPAQILDGPSPIGLYTVRLLEHAAGKPDLNEAITRLRANPSVLFATPALPQAVQATRTNSGGG